MQTFLPFPDFERSAQCLDNKRLGKQRLECLQILATLNKGKYSCAICKDSWDNCCKMPMHCPQKKRITPWYNHPAVKMWANNPLGLVVYGRAICEEWIKRGFKDTCKDRLADYYSQHHLHHMMFPLWLGREDFHLSHQSNLIRKDAEHYRPIFGLDVSDSLPYIWPV